MTTLDHQMTIPEMCEVVEKVGHELDSLLKRQRRLWTVIDLARAALRDTSSNDHRKIDNALRFLDLEGTG